MNYDKELSDILMREIGLDVDSNQCIIDQDTGMPLEYNGKKIVYEGNRSKTSIPFDPLNNTKMMSHLFSYYTEKVAEEDGRYFNMYYQVKDSDTKSHLEALDASSGTVLKSEPYTNDTLKYADLIFKINGVEMDLTKKDKKMLKEKQLEQKQLKKELAAKKKGAKKK